jgi:hypothetical protein
MEITDVAKIPRVSLIRGHLAQFRSNRWHLVFRVASTFQEGFSRALFKVEAITLHFSFCRLSFELFEGYVLEIILYSGCHRIRAMTHIAVSNYISLHCVMDVLKTHTLSHICFRYVCMRKYSM